MKTLNWTIDMQDTVQQYNVWSPEVRANPHPVYAWMRAESPV